MAVEEVDVLLAIRREAELRQRLADESKWGGLWTGCAACLHGQAVHKSHRGRYRREFGNSAGSGPCLDCECPKFWGGRCWRCNDFCSRQGGACAMCYRAMRFENELWDTAYRNSPEQIALREIERARKEEAGWIRTGRQTLREVRRLLNPSQPREPQSSDGRE